MVKYKDLSEDVRHLKDELGKKWIAVISMSALLGLGVWMLLDPVSPGHSSIEKSTVYLLKEIWSFPAGLILTSIALVAIYYPVKRIIALSGKVWIKWDNGYYFFDRKVRKSGLNAMYDGAYLVVFYPEGNTTLLLTSYDTAPIAQYQKVKESAYNCNDAYWNADESGYLLFYKGKHLTDLSSEFRNDDLIVSADSHSVQFKLPNYRNLKDNKIRTAEVMGERNRIR